jgi:hypothetical protein
MPVNTGHCHVKCGQLIQSRTHSRFPANPRPPREPRPAALPTTATATAPATARMPWNADNSFTPPRLAQAHLL